MSFGLTDVLNKLGADIESSIDQKDGMIVDYSDNQNKLLSDDIIVRIQNDHTSILEEVLQAAQNVSTSNTSVSGSDLQKLQSNVDGIRSDLSTFLKNDGIHVVTQYNNGSSWYRKWSNGWIEQGSYQSLAFSSFVATLTFPIPFTTTSYSFVATGKSMDTSTYYFDNVNIAYADNKSTVSISLSAEQNRELIMSWYACGY